MPYLSLRELRGDLLAASTMAPPPYTGPVIAEAASGALFSIFIVSSHTKQFKINQRGFAIVKDRPSISSRETLLVRVEVRNALADSSLSELFRFTGSIRFGST
jgi:hypothetical protein